MSEIIIPERLAVRLSHDKTWDSCVTQLKKNIEPLLSKDPDFFPDYTIHGIDHINRCLDIADHLIDFDTLSEEPKKTDPLTPRDVAFLVCGIMLHDMGMFLRPDGLRKLVKMDGTDDAFGGKPWNDEWSNYVDRTKRLSQEKMRYHFGKVIPVTEDCVNHTDTDDNKRIIGEFLRQHHPRQAHELALSVLPGSIDTDLFKNTNLKEKDRKLIGILARSHGMDIRDTEDYVNKHIGKGPKPYNTPIFYLMTVLRTADALDADERRAPEALERQQKINVPISVEEWTWNQCIDPDGCDWLKEQKNRHIEADPKSSPQYVQLDKWLKGVQADLDLCWSILAEKYSHPDDRYRLSIHRVVSNIHEPGIRETMNEKFLTKEAKITANPEIVKLMMAPLYGDEPTYGVRELLQNAVDACVERSAKEGQGYKGKVTIRVDEESFIIEDNGMGMDENVLLNYYLSVGSSYRNSDEWKQDFMVDGKSQIARTGRFGVGFLAPFLLGNQITVHTQHMNDRKGYVFSFSQDSCPLNIRREKRSEGIGTTIIIQLKKDVYNQLKDNLHWCQWYCFDDPEVQYFMDNQELPCVFDRIPRDPDDPGPWIRLETGKYEDYFWLLSSSKTGPGRILPEPYFLCNGIRIEDFPSEIGEFSGWSIQTPKISLLDPHNNLQIDLARKQVLRIPEEDSLVKEIYRYMIAEVLLHAWDLNKKCSVPGKTDVPCLQQGNAFIPCYPVFLAAADVSRYLTVCYLLDPAGERPQHTELIRPDILTADVPVLVHICPKDVHPDDYWPRRDSELKRCLHRIFIPHYLYEQEAMPYPCKEIWIPGEIFIPYNLYTLSFLGREFTPEDPKVIQWNLSQLPDQHELWEIAASKEYGYWERRSVLRQKYSQYIMPVDLDRFTADKYGFVMDCIAPDHILAQKSTLFAELLHEYLGDDIWIPFDMAERKKKFPKAFEELKVYMDHIRKYPIE